jgi:hypothetical protein
MTLSTEAEGLSLADAQSRISCWKFHSLPTNSLIHITNKINAGCIAVDTAGCIYKQSYTALHFTVFTVKNKN